jgi:formylglycine-generating enzyme required for sulfatase activity
VSGVKVSWNFGANGITAGDVVDVKVFGIEMVYIPEGAFYAGDHATSTAAFRQGASDNDPWYITSEADLTVTNGAGNGTGSGQTALLYYYVGDGNGGEDATGSAFTIPALFPKGYGAFYMMKGEVSQGEWVTFFNTLGATQRGNRDITSAANAGKNSDAVVNRNNVSWGGSGDAILPGGVTDYRGVAANFLSWDDLAAYLDWAGLRPMSELEYEKASRGPLLAVAGEYAWGTSSVLGIGSITNPGLATERGNGGSNVNVGSVAGGPTRVGSFSSGVSGIRQASGGSYYGVMDLSGNVWERAITVGNVGGRTYQGARHGDGELDSNGSSDVAVWPSLGAGFRGGDWNDGAPDSRISNRRTAANVLGNRFLNFGGRGVRWAAP